MKHCECCGEPTTNEPDSTILCDECGTESSPCNDCTLTARVAELEAEARRSDLTISQLVTVRDRYRRALEKIADRNVYEDGDAARAALGFSHQLPTESPDKT